MPVEANIVEILKKKKIAYEVKEFVYFNPGKHDKSFKIKAWDLKKACQPKML